MAQFDCNFISYALQRSVSFSIIVPSMTCPECMHKDPFYSGAFGSANVLPEPNTSVLSHRKEHRYPLVYLLHGFANDCSAWLRYTRVERYAEERNIAVVTFSAENKAYLDRINHDRFFLFLNKELPEFVTSNFYVSREPRHTYIAGLSMGGYGTVLHALKNPAKYRAFGAFSAGLSRKTEDAAVSDIADTRVDLFALAKAIHTQKQAFPRGYMACGEDDPLFDLNIEFYQLLTSCGAATTWEQLPGYGHEWDFWDIQIEKFLDWIPRDDYYASLGKRTL